MSMTRWLFVVFAFLMIVAMLCPLIRADPVMPTRPLPEDANNNGISDALDREIADNIANGHGDDYVRVIVMLEYEPSDVDLGAFAAAGGTVVAGPWKEAIYGFGGSIQYDKINTFAQNCQDLIFIEKDQVISINDPPIFTIEPLFPLNISSFPANETLSPIKPVDSTVPEYSAPTLLFIMIGVALSVCFATKTAKNKKAGHCAQSS